MILTICSLFVGQFSFLGGSSEDYFALVSSHFDLPIVSCAVSKDVRKLEVDWPLDTKGKPLPKDVGNAYQSQKIAQHYDSNINSKSGLAFRPRVMPWYRFKSTYEDRIPTAEYPEMMEIVTVKDGLVQTLPIKGKFFVPSYLPFLSFTKNVSVHPFFAQTPLQLSKFSLDEVRFLDMLAFALGGKIIKKRDYNFIDLDPDVIRQQLIESLKDTEKSTKRDLDKRHARLSMEIVALANGDEIRKMIEGENTFVTVFISKASLANRLAQEFVVAYIQEARSLEHDRRGVSKAMAELIAKECDLADGFYGSLETNGKVKIMISKKSNSRAFVSL